MNREKIVFYIHMERNVNNLFTVVKMNFCGHFER